MIDNKDELIKSFVNERMPDIKFKQITNKDKKLIENTMSYQFFQLKKAFVSLFIEIKKALGI